MARRRGPTWPRLDRKRKKKGSNDEWTHPHDPDAKIAKMKDGRTYLAHKAEHAIDLETGAIVGITVQDADDGDTTTLQAHSWRGEPRDWRILQVDWHNVQVCGAQESAKLVSLLRMDRS